MRKIITIVLISLFLSGCISPEAEIQERVAQTQTALGLALASPAVAVTFTPLPATDTAVPSASPTPESSPTPAETATLAPDAWQDMPVLPASLSQKMCQVYKLGQMMGNNPRAFSKVGDCQSMTPGFLGYIEEGKYKLGDYVYLQPVIDYFAGSFGRNSLAVKDGLTASGVTAALWNDWKDCGTSETPLDCEYRIHRPGFAFISLGTNDANGLVPFETTLRRVINVTMGHGVVPILVTKADNAEGDHSINATITRLAYEYEIPLWNFWLAVQPLPDHGLRSPEHLTEGEDFSTADFSKPYYMKFAFNVRNLQALQILDMLMHSCDISASDVTPTP